VFHLENDYSPMPEKSQRRAVTADRVDKNDYDLNYHLKITSPALQKMAIELQKFILQLPSVEEKLGQKTGITYRTTKSFARLEFRKTWIQVLIRDPKYIEDKKGLVKDITSHEWGYRGMVKLTEDSDIEYIFGLIKASYNSTL